jgi:hypothetical protein
LHTLWSRSLRDARQLAATTGANRSGTDPNQATDIAARMCEAVPMNTGPIEQGY